MLRAFLLLLLLPGLAHAQVVSQTVLSGSSVADGLFFGIATSDARTDWASTDATRLILRYPGAPSIWGAAFITPSLAVERPGLDMSSYRTLIIELNGAAGTTVDIGIKDSMQPDDGTEARVAVQLTGEWQSFQIPLSRFTGVNLKSIYVLTEIVFLGSPSQTVSVRNIRYTLAPAAITKLLPQFVFGGGWYTALYFTNTRESALSLSVRFAGNNGQPLFVPAVGGTSTTVTLPARGTTVIEAQNQGALSIGYASADLPDGVLGYAVFRQSVQGYPDQEAVVPFLDTSANAGTLIWDDTNVSTAVAIVNPSSINALVTMVLRDTAGQLVGTSVVAIPARNKVAVFLSQIPGLGGVAGKRGSADISVSAGAAVAVLGIRFKGVAFTSIPTTSETRQ